MSTPHFRFPFRFANGSAQVVEQDTPEEIEQGVEVLIRTELGERLEVPDFGIEDRTFRNDLDVAAIEAAAAEWDERVEVDIVERPGHVQGLIRDLLVSVKKEDR